MKKFKTYFLLILAVMIVTSACNVFASEQDLLFYEYDFEIENPVYKYHGTGAVKPEGDANGTYIDQYNTALRFVRQSQEKGQLLGIVESGDTERKKVLHAALGGYGGGVGTSASYKANTAYVYSVWIKADANSSIGTRKIALLPLFDTGYGTLANASMYVLNTDENAWVDQSKAGSASFNARPSALFHTLSKTDTEWKKVERIFYMSNTINTYIGLSFDGVWNANAASCYLDNIRVEKLLNGIYGSDSVTVTYDSAKTEAYTLDTSSELDISDFLTWSVDGDNPYVSIDENGILKIEPYANVDSVTIRVNVNIQGVSEEFTKTISVNYEGTPLPYVKNPRIVGTVALGETIEAGYDFLKFADIGDNASQIKWLISDAYDSGFSVFSEESELELTSQHSKKWIKASILPKDDKGNVNPTSVETLPVSLPEVPVAKEVQIVGKSKIGVELEGKYLYEDFNDNGINEDEKENGSILSWYRLESLGDTTPEKIAEGNKYTLTEDDVLNYLKFGVIPKNNATLGDVAEEYFSEPFQCPVEIGNVPVAPKGALTYFDFEIDNPTYYDNVNAKTTTDREELPGAVMYTQISQPTEYMNIASTSYAGKGRILGIFDEETDGIEPVTGSKTVKFAINGYGGGIGVRLGTDKSYVGKKLYVFKTHIRAAGDSIRSNMPIAFMPVFMGGKQVGDLKELGNNQLFVYSASQKQFVDQSVTSNDMYTERSVDTSLTLTLTNSNKNWQLFERVFYLENSGTNPYLGIGHDGWASLDPFHVFLDDLSITPVFAEISGSNSIAVTHGEPKTANYSLVKSTDFITDYQLTWSVDGENPYVTVDENGVLKVEPYANVDEVTLRLRIDTPFNSEELTKTVALNYIGKPLPYVTYPNITGTVAVGETLTASYQFLQMSGIGDDASQVEWLISDAPDKDFVKVSDGATFELKTEHVRKWVKASILPKDTNGLVNPLAVETLPVSLPEAPVAKTAEIVGKHAVGAELEGKYVYYDFNDNGMYEAEKESGSIINWYRLDSLVDTTRDKIAEGSKYTMTSADSCKYLQLGVIPKNMASLGDQGIETFSELFKCPTPPVASNVKIKGTVALGGTLTGEYTFDSEFDAPEGSSVYTWTVNGIEYSHENSITVTADMNGKTLRFTVLPIASVEPYQGVAAFNEIFVSFQTSEYTVNNGFISGGGFGGGDGGDAVIKPTVPGNQSGNDASIPTTSIGGFSDVSGHWAEASIKAMAADKILNGYEDATFRPDNAVKRSEAISMLVRAFSIEETEEKTEFSDVTKEKWFYSAIMAASSNGIVSGFDGNFLPEKEITRQEFAVMIMNLLRLYPQSELPETERTAYLDDEKISGWAREAVYSVSCKQLMQGFENHFSPNESLTRAEAAVVVERLYQALGIQYK